MCVWKDVRKTYLECDAKPAAACCRAVHKRAREYSPPLANNKTPINRGILLFLSHEKATTHFTPFK